MPSDAALGDFSLGNGKKLTTFGNFLMIDDGAFAQELGEGESGESTATSSVEDVTPGHSWSGRAWDCSAEWAQSKPKWDGCLGESNLPTWFAPPVNADVSNTDDVNDVIGETDTDLGDAGDRSSQHRFQI